MSKLRLSACVLLLLPSAVLACIWDHDTLKMERARFPETLELITGKFLRHSREFYEWRIQDRLDKLESVPDELAYYDDLAAAYDKTGQHIKAIETMLVKEKKKPDLYETYANLGTFYIHGAQLEKGLENIDKAIQINPDAHFGREKYQRHLVQFILLRRKEGITKPPLSRSWCLDRIYPDRASPNSVHVEDYGSFVLGPSRGRNVPVEQRQAAIKGVLGMMRFGHFDSPILLEALGSLLSAGYADTEQADAKRLAARAYLKASYHVSDETARVAFRLLATEVLSNQTTKKTNYEPANLAEIEATFKQELAEAKTWYEVLHDQELGWIRAGKDPEREFDLACYRELEVSPSMEGEDPNAYGGPVISFTVGTVFGLVICVSVVLVLVRWQRRNVLKGTPN